MNYVEEIINPSILLCETFYPIRYKPGIMLDAVKKIMDINFYRSVEIDVIEDEKERKSLSEIFFENNIMVTQWVSTVLAEKKLDLSSIDPDTRKKSVNVLKKYIYHAAECGVTNFAVLSGEDPGEQNRKIASEAFFLSLCELSEAIKEYKSMRIIFEALDRGANKNRLIGPTSEALEILKRVRELYPAASLCWDSAHFALCGENIFESLNKMKGYISQIHLSNAVLDRENSLFGDRHMKIGEPGFLNYNTIAEIIKEIVKKDIFNGHKPYIAVEVRTGEDENPWNVELFCRDTIIKSVNIYNQIFQE